MCDLDENAFMLVLPTVLFYIPCLIRLIPSFILGICFYVTFYINTPCFLFYLILRSFLFISNKSFTFSLYIYTIDILILISILPVFKLVIFAYFLLNKSFNTRGTKPYCLGLFRQSPTIVCVLPELVWPQQNIVPLMPII